MKLVSITMVILGICMLLTNAYASEESEWVKGILNSDDSVGITNEINEQQIKEADYLIQQGSTNPVVWYLRGGFGTGRLGFYYDDLQIAGKFYRLNSPKVQALIKEYQSYYQKAMELDDNPDAPDHLTGMMLINIGTDVIGDPAIKVRAQEKLAALARAGKDGTGNEMLEWNTYEARLGIYVDAKDYENALKIVNEMIDRFGSSEEVEGYKRHMEEVIAQQKQAAVQDAYAQADTYTAAKPEAAEPVKESTQTVEPKQVAKPKKIAEAVVESQPAPTSDNTMLWWLLGGGIGLLGVIVLLLRRKKS